MAEGEGASIAAHTSGTPGAATHRSVEDLVFSQHPGTRTPEVWDSPGVCAERQFTLLDSPEDRERFMDHTGYLRDRFIYSSSGVRFIGHTKYVSCFTLHEGHIFTGSGDNTARHWDMRSGRCKAVYEGHTGTVLSLLVHASSGCLFTGSLDRTVRRWKIETGALLGVLEEHPGGARCMDRLEQFLYVGCGNGECRRWDLGTNELAGMYEGHQGAIYTVIANADFIWTGGADGVSHCWDICSGTLCTSYYGHTRYVNCLHLALVEDEHVLFTGSGDRTIRKYVMGDGTFVQELKGHANTVWCMEHLRNDLFSGGADNVVIKWDMKSGAELMRFEGHTETVYSIAIRQDERNHVGVRCNDTGQMPITGTRYKKRGGKGINLCEHAFSRQPANEKAKYIKVESFPDALYSGSKDCTVRKWNITEPGLENECYPEGCSFDTTKSRSP